MTTSSLASYLQALCSADSHQGIWVNPENIDEYRIGQFVFENGGIEDDWVCIGSLDRLSFGFQSEHDAIKSLLEEGEHPRNHSKDIRSYTYNERKIWVSVKGILNAYSEGHLNPDFLESLAEDAESIMDEWANFQADYFVSDQLPLIIEQTLANRRENQLVYS
jgi:hypothetical protein